MKKINNFLCDENTLLKDVLKLISKNKMGFIFFESKDKVLNGLLTDGDIRNYLINNDNLNIKASKIYNTNFRFKSINDSRESIIKLFDDNIKFIPILDENNKLVKIIFKDDFPIYPESKIVARSKSPVRISFAGGGSDLTYFFKDNKAAVLNASINLYSNCTLSTRNDDKIIIDSYDLNDTLTINSFKDLKKTSNNKFDLILSTLKMINPNYGFNLNLISDFKIGSGLGGSSVLVSSILGCFNELRVDKWTDYELAEIAYQIERINLGVSGGWQDQYATIFGGFNLMEFNSSENIIQPLNISRKLINELEMSLILCNTGKLHNSSNIHDDQKIELSKINKQILVKENVEFAYKLRDFLLKEDLRNFAKIIDDAWLNKRKISDKITNSDIDKIYNGAKNHGALGGKLLGAGGGGYLLFFTSPLKRNKLVKWIESIGLTYTSFNFDLCGLQSWSYRKK